MPPDFDHLIVIVNDRDESVAFYSTVLGFADEGRDGPFSIIRVNATCTLQLAAHGTQGGEHFAFAMPRAEFDATLGRVRERGMPYGDAFDTVGSGRGPGKETG